MRRILHILMIFIVACSSSSHLAVLQAVAWTGMFFENVQSHDVAAALAKTLDGANPCRLCDAISDASEQAPDGGDGAPLPNGSELVWKLIPIESVVVFPPACERLAVRREPRSGEARIDLPSVPPPRAI